MSGTTPAEAPEKHVDAPPPQSGDIHGLPQPYTSDQADTMRSTMAKAEQQATAAAAQHLSPMEISASADKTNQTIRIEEKRDGKVVETDVIYKDGTKVQHKFDDKGRDTETQTDKSGKFIHSEVKDANGNLIQESQRLQDTIATYDGHGKLLSATRELPGGGKSVETTDKQGNHVTTEYDKQGHLNHSETKDTGGHIVRTEDRDKNGNTHIEKRDKDGKVLGTEDSDKFGRRTITTWDKQGNETASRYEPGGKLSGVEKKDSKGHIVFDETIGSDGSKSFAHYDALNRITSRDQVDSHGAKTSHSQFDAQGRETESALYKDGKIYSDTKSVWNDKTGQHTDTHTGEGGYVDSVKIANKDGSYAEYGYNQEKEQTYYEAGQDGDHGGYARYYRSDKEYKTRPMS